MDAEAGKAEARILRVRCHDAVLEAEQVRLVQDWPRLPVRHHEQVHPVAEQEAAMEELKLEVEVVAPPERPLRIEADIAVVIIGELVELGGSLDSGAL